MYSVHIFKGHLNLKTEVSSYVNVILNAGQPVQYGRKKVCLVGWRSKLTMN
jgi:hypothetical protein